MSDVSVTVQRLQSSGDLRSRIEQAACDKCQGLCWTVEVWAYDIIGTDAKACLLYRPHIPNQAGALHGLGTWWLAHERGVRRAEQAAWLLEHQDQLW